MNPRLAHLLVRLYPRPWRERYGAEFEALLQTGRGGVRMLANVVWSALHERVFPTLEGFMNQPTHSLAMSLTALAMLGGAYIFAVATGHGGLVREPDEGSIAHVWQLLMAGQMPILAFFAIKWLPRAPRQTLYVLGLQAGAVLAAMAPVYFLNL